MKNLKPLITVLTFLFATLFASADEIQKSALKANYQMIYNLALVP